MVWTRGQWARVAYSIADGAVMGLTMLLPVSQFLLRRDWSDEYVDAITVAHAVFVGLAEAAMMYSFQASDLKDAVDGVSVSEDSNSLSSGSDTSALSAASRPLLVGDLGEKAPAPDAMSAVASFEVDHATGTVTVCHTPKRGMQYLTLYGLIAIRYYTFLVDLYFDKEAMYEWLGSEPSQSVDYGIDICLLCWWLVVLRFLTGNEIFNLHNDAMRYLGIRQDAVLKRMQCILPRTLCDKPVSLQKWWCVVGGMMMATQTFLQLLMSVPLDIVRSGIDTVSSLSPALADAARVVLGLMLLSAMIGNYARVCFYEARESFSNFCDKRQYLKPGKRLIALLRWNLALGMLPLISSCTITGVYYPDRYNVFGSAQLGALRVALAIFFTCVEGYECSKVEHPQARAFLDRRQRELDAQTSRAGPEP